MAESQKQFAACNTRRKACARDYHLQEFRNRARQCVNGSNAIGIAVRTLKRRGLIHSFGYTASTGPRRRGGTDQEKARRWLAEKGVSTEVPAHVEAVQTAKAEPVNPSDTGIDAAPPSEPCPHDGRGQSADTAPPEVEA